MTIDGPPATDTSRVYAHTADTLFLLNNMTFATTEIGPFNATDPMLDLAIDSNDRMIGVTRDAVWSINSATGAATHLKDLPANAEGASSLSFVPDPAGGADLLVTADVEGDVYTIDPATGAATMVGNYGTGTGGVITSSGDIFGVKDFGIFATVNVGDDHATNDVLAELKPSQGWKAVLKPNTTGFNNIFGVGFWGGKIYGFVDNGGAAGTGQVIEIDPVTGIGTAKASGTVRWYGAAVATDAPIIGRVVE